LQPYNNSIFAVKKTADFIAMVDNLGAGVIYVKYGKFYFTSRGRMAAIILNGRLRVTRSISWA